MRTGMDVCSCFPHSVLQRVSIRYLFAEEKGVIEREMSIRPADRQPRLILAVNPWEMVLQSVSRLL